MGDPLGQLSLNGVLVLRPLRWMVLLWLHLV